MNSRLQLLAPDLLLQLADASAARQLTGLLAAHAVASQGKSPTWLQRQAVEMLATGHVAPLLVSADVVEAEQLELDYLETDEALVTERYAKFNFARFAMGLAIACTRTETSTAEALYEFAHARDDLTLVPAAVRQTLAST